MLFEEFLSGKKIDSAAFRAAEPERWQEWSQLFLQVSPASFTAQKLYLINPTRRKYPLQAPAEAVQPAPAAPAAPKPARPVFKPKIN